MARGCVCSGQPEATQGRSVEAEAAGTGSQRTTSRIFSRVRGGFQFTPVAAGHIAQIERNLFENKRFRISESISNSMREYPNYRNEILSKLTGIARSHNLNGTAVFRDLVEGWISAGCPSEFDVKKIVHTHKMSSKDLWLQLMETSAALRVNRT